MKRLRIILLFCWAVFSVLSAEAQFQEASARIDSSSILIGDHVHLSLEWTVLKNAQLNWPVFKDTLSAKIELVEVGPIDTIKAEKGDVCTYKQLITLTCFDSGSYYIPSIHLQYRLPNDTTIYKSQTAPILLMVNTVQVDTTKAFRDIKEPLQAPLTLWEILPWIGGGLLLAVIIAFVIYIIVRKLRKKPVFGRISRPVLPPHLQALNELEELRIQQLWQKGRGKEFQSRLSDIVRQYVEGRFAIPAMEMITPDLLERMGKLDVMGPEVLAKMKQILELADLVKFARFKPLPDEHDASLKLAVQFVQLTMPFEAVSEENVPNDEREEDV